MEFLINSLRFIAAAPEYSESPESFGEVSGSAENVPHASAIQYGIYYRSHCYAGARLWLRQKVRKRRYDGSGSFSPFYFTFARRG